MTDDLWLKLRMLFRFYGLRGWREWYRDVWTEDGSAQLCCSGHECGCWGADLASQWESALSRRKGTPS